MPLRRARLQPLEAHCKAALTTAMRQKTGLLTKAVGLITEAQQAEAVLPKVQVTWWHWGAAGCSIHAGPDEPQPKWTRR
jgi:hypothetical protein